MKFIKRLVISFLLLSEVTGLYAQNNADSVKISLDVLKAPVSPAANLIGISDAQIERPSDPSAFMTLIHQTTNNLSSFPNSFAVDLAPAWIFNGRKISLEDYMRNDLVRNISQSFVVSFATKGVDSLEQDASSSPFTTKIATGIKFSLLRGDVNAETKKALKDLHTVRMKTLNDYVNDIKILEANNVQLKKIDSNINEVMTQESIPFEQRLLLVESFKLRKQAVLDSIQKAVWSEPNELKEAAENVKFYRTGWKLDFAAGMVFDFPKASFDKGDFVKGGAWLTGGYEGKGASILGIWRFLNSPDQIYADDSGLLKTDGVSTLDYGLRFLYTTFERKITLGGEGIYRSAINVNELDPTWRFTFNASYDLGKNKLLTFILGRDFDGAISKDGNVIAGLNLLLGFDSKK